MLKLGLDKDQLDDLSFCLSSPYSILANDMGTGKSAVAIAVKDRIKNSRCLIVAPSHLLLNWKFEIDKFLDGQSISIMSKGEHIHYPVCADFVLISYGLAIKAPELFAWASMIIFDEAHYLKEMKTTRTIELHRLIYEHNVPRVHLLTGTPIKNRVKEFYSLIALCSYNPRDKNPKFLLDYPEDVTFAEEFSLSRKFKVEYRPGRFVQAVKWYGIKNETKLRGLLKGIYRRRKLNMGLPVYKEVQIGESVKDDLLAWYDKSFNGEVPPAGVKLKIASAMLKTEGTIKYVKDLIEELGLDRVVIYSDHVEPCKTVAKAFNVEPITGEMLPSKRAKIALDFQNGEGLKVIVATIGSFSDGVTLTRAWNTIYNDFCWVPGTLRQSEARTNRKGQTKRCVMHYMLGSIADKKILREIKEKEKVIETVYEEA